MQTNAELEAAIRNNPEDDAGYLVYGDWLSERGERIGKLVAVQHALAKKPDDPELRAAEMALFAEDIASFFGPVHPFAAHAAPVWQADRLGRKVPWDGAWRFGYAETQWHNGFMRDVSFDTHYYCDDDESQGGEQAAAILAGLLAAPAARFVQRIVIGDVWGDDYEGPELHHALLAVAASPCAAGLRELHCVGGEHDISGVRCDLGTTGAQDLWERLPALEALTLYGNDTDVGVFSLPKLRRLTYQSGGLSGGAVNNLCASALPALEHVELWLGRESYGGSVTLEHLWPLLDGSAFPALKSLGLKNSEFTDEICRAVVVAPVLPRLEALDLTMGMMTDVGAQVLLDNAEKLAHLKLAVAGYLSDGIIAKLEAMGATVGRRGKPDERYQYTEVGE